MAKLTFDKDGLAKVSGTLTVYSYDAKTGEYNGTNEEYLASGVGIPANACTVAPPVAEAGNVAVFANGSWMVIEDHRGETVYSTTNGRPQLVNLTGDYPAGTTTLTPATDFDKWDGEKWVTDTDEQQAEAVQAAESEKVARISEANSITQIWQTQLRLEMITDMDKAKLILWMKYAKAVQDVDTVNLTEVVWPFKPSFS